jgi:L-lactate dehydrogenase complex protein LldF
MKFLFRHPTLYNVVLKIAPIVNKMPRSLIYNSFNDWGKGRELPVFAEESFTRMWKKGKVKKHE